MGNFKRAINIFFFAAIVLAGCKQEKSDLEELEALRKEYWGSKDENESGLTHKAVRLDSAYKAFVFEHPNDTATPEYLWENASLHLNTLKNPDQALVLLQQLYTKYPDHRRAPHALYLAGYTFENVLNKPTLAIKNYQHLIDNYPDHQFAKQASISIKYVGKDPSEMLNEILDSSKNQADTATVK